MGNAWGLILAGGEGRRLHSMTTIPSGMTVPTQYCSLCGGDSLLEDALNRAAAVVPRERVCTIVSAEHGRWWRAMSLGLEPQNLFIQPSNRGTAGGMGISAGLAV
jgi:mannose-1-phosphate guanylyltransferase